MKLLIQTGNLITTSQFEIIHACKMCQLPTCVDKTTFWLRTKKVNCMHVMWTETAQDHVYYWSSPLKLWVLPRCVQTSLTSKHTVLLICINSTPKQTILVSWVRSKVCMLFCSVPVQLTMLQRNVTVETWSTNMLHWCYSSFIVDICCCKAHDTTYTIV
jgi:hypothetical protein